MKSLSKKLLNQQLAKKKMKKINGGDGAKTNGYGGIEGGWTDQNY